MNCWNLDKHTTINNWFYLNKALEEKTFSLTMKLTGDFVACQHASLYDICKPATVYRAGMRSSFTCSTCFTSSDTPYGVSNSSKVKILKDSNESH